MRKYGQQPQGSHNRSSRSHVYQFQAVLICWIAAMVSQPFNSKVITPIEKMGLSIINGNHIEFILSLIILVFLSSQLYSHIITRHNVRFLLSWKISIFQLRHLWASLSELHRQVIRLRGPYRESKCHRIIENI